MKKYFLSLIVFIFVLGSLIGCTPSKRPIPKTTVPKTTTPKSTVQKAVPRQTKVIPRTTVPGPVPAPSPATRVSPRPAPAPTVPTPTVPGPVPRTTSMSGAGAKANKLAKEIAKEKEIKSATVVVTGNTAMVGVEFNKQYKGKLTDSIKKKVDKRVKTVEPSIKKVAVTADPNLLTRIKTISSDVGKGKPLSGLTKEIQEVLRRIMPK